MNQLPEPVCSIEGITEYRLDNGLQVLFFPDPTTATVTVNITYLVGSRHEVYGQTGLAHLLEHLQFKGTPNFPNVAQAIRDRGGSFNGTTSADRTNYYETLPATSENLAFALSLEAQRIRGSHLLESDLATERSVVCNELDQGENQPFRLLLQRTLATSYAWHNYGKPTIGNRSDVENVSLEVMRQFYDCYYQPDNAVLVVAGSFDPVEAWAVVKKTFGRIQRPDRIIPPQYTTEPPQDGLRQVMVQRVGEVPLLAVVYHIPSGADPAFATLDVTARILAARPAGRLYQKFVETHRAASVSSAVSSRHDPGYLLVAAALEPKQDLDQFQTDILTAIRELGTAPPTWTEVNRAKQQLLKEWEDDYLDSESAAISLTEWAAQGDWRLMFLHRDRLEKVTETDVQQISALYLNDNNVTVGRFVPVSERVSLPTTIQSSLSAALVGYQGSSTWEPGEKFEPSLANIQSRSFFSNLGSSFKMALLPKRTRGQRVCMNWRFHFGDPQTLLGKETAAELLGRLLCRGSLEWSFEGIRDRLTELRAELRIDSQQGALDILLQTRRVYVHEVCELIESIMRKPRFSRQEFDVIKQQSLVGIRTRVSDPQALASREYQRRLWPYPASDVRWIPTWREEQSLLEAATVADVEAFYHDCLAPTECLFAAVGDFDQDNLPEWAARIVAGWPVKGTFQRIRREALLQERQEVSLAVQDKPNAAFYAGGTLPLTATHASVPGLVIANEILGGSGLSSRLGDRIRQREGLSYTVNSGLRLANFAPASVFSLYAIAAPQNRHRLWQAVDEEIERWLADGPEVDELHRAKAAFLHSASRRRNDDFRVLQLLLEILDTQRTFQDYMDEETAIRELDPEKVRHASREFLRPQTWAFVSAGNFVEDRSVDP